MLNQQDSFSRVVNHFSGLGSASHDSFGATKIAKSYLSRDRATIDAAHQTLWPCQKVCDFYPQAMAKEWGEFILGSDTRKKAGKIMSKVTEYFDDARFLYERAQKLANKDGGAIILRLVDDGNDLSMPIDESRINSFTYSRIYERWEIQPVPQTFGDTISYHYDPQYYWFFAGSKGIKKIHKDRVLRFRGTFTSYQCLAENQGWEDSVLLRFLEPCLRYVESLGYVAGSVKSFEIVVYLFQNLFQYLEDDEYSNRLIQRLKLNQQSMSALRGLMADKETEDVKIISRQYGGVSDIIEKIKDEMQAASGLTKPQLFSEHPTGLSATGESERLAEADAVKMRQNSLWLPLIKPDIRYYLLTPNSPTKGKIPDNWRWEWRSLFQSTPQEEADLRQKYANTDKTNIESQIYSSEEARNSRYAGASFNKEIILSSEPTLESSQ